MRLSRKCSPTKILVTALLAVSFGVCAGEPSKRVLTPEDAVRTTRILSAPITSPGSATGDDVALSPDGNRYVIRTIQGDPEKNGIWLNLYSGKLGSLQEAARPTLVARLFSTGLAREGSMSGADQDGQSTNEFRWLAN